MPARTVGWLLWLAMGGLAALALVWQIRNPPRPPVVRSAPPPELPAVAPLERFSLPPASDYGEITARPLFIAERRPEPPPPEETTPGIPAAGSEQKPMLIGVMIAPESTVALLRPEEPNAKVLRVKPGESVGDWRLETILPNRVVLRKGQATRELLLERPKKPAKPKAPARLPGRPESQAAPPAGAPPEPQPAAVPPAGAPLEPQPAVPPFAPAPQQ
jgi:general secretion pathway protein N